MSEALTRHKKVQAGHRSSATRLMHQLESEYEIDDGPTLDRLVQCKLSLTEKLDKLHEIDETILNLIDEENIESEIEQADQFKERIQLAVIRLDHKISARERLSAVLPSSSHSEMMLPDTVPVPSYEPPVSGSDVPATTSSAPVIATTSKVSPPAHHTTTAVPDTSTTTVVTSAIVTPVLHHTVAEMSISKVIIMIIYYYYYYY